MNTLDSLHIQFPRSLYEALQLQAAEETRGRLLAGGTDLMAQWASGLPLPSRATSIFDLAELQTIEETNDVLIIGAGVTHTELQTHPAIRRHLPALAAAAATIGATQIQNRGTIGGNVANASPAGDLAPALLVTDGFAVVQSLRGVRTIPLTRFWLGYRKIDCQPDEILTALQLPKRKRAKEAFRKLGTRQAQAISKVMAACRLTIRDGICTRAAIAIGSVAPTAIRLAPVEDLLKGQPLTSELIDAAEAHTRKAITPITDIRSTADYRQWVAGRLVRAFLETHLAK